jgi:hydrogenase maturation protease
MFRLLGENLSKACAFTNSMHQTDLLDTLANCSLVGNVPDDVILYGIEPFNYKDMSAALSPELEKMLPVAMEAVLKEVETAGGTYSLRSENNPAMEKIYVPRDTSRNT